MAEPTLVPQRPPGRSTRKASAYSAEIQRLQGLGYTLDAIREALASAGVIVSKSTVQREATRSAGPFAATASTSLQPVSSPLPENTVLEGSQELRSTPGHVDLTQHERGRDVAAAFVSKRTTNPLLRKDQR